MSLVVTGQWMHGDAAFKKRKGSGSGKGGKRKPAAGYKPFLDVNALRSLLPAAKSTDNLHVKSHARTLPRLVQNAIDTKIEPRLLRSHSSEVRFPVFLLVILTPPCPPPHPTKKKIIECLCLSQQWR
jgi:hypothetical protein